MIQPQRYSKTSDSNQIELGGSKPIRLDRATFLKLRISSDALHHAFITLIMTSHYLSAVSNHIKVDFCPFMIRENVFFKPASPVCWATKKY